VVDGTRRIRFLDYGVLSLAKAKKGLESHASGKIVEWEAPDDLSSSFGTCKLHQKKGKKLPVSNNGYKKEGISETSTKSEATTR
jgi:hypothetical protein